MTGSPCGANMAADEAGAPLPVRDLGVEDLCFLFFLLLFSCNVIIARYATARPGAVRGLGGYQLAWGCEGAGFSTVLYGGGVGVLFFVRAFIHFFCARWGLAGQQAGFGALRSSFYTLSPMATARHLGDERWSR